MEQQLEALIALIDQMAAKPALTAVLRAAVLGLPGLCTVQRASVVMLRADNDVAFVVTEAEAAHLDNLVLRMEDYPQIRDLVGRRQPLAVTAPLAAALFDNTAPGLAGTPASVEQAVLFPLLRREKVVGALVLQPEDNQPGGPLMQAGRMMASVLSVALGNALEQDMLLSTQRELLRKQEDARQEILNLRQFSDSFDQSFDGILICQSEGAIRYANAAAGAILQRRPDTLRGRDFFALLASHGAALAKRAFDGDSVGDAYGYIDLVVVDDAAANTVISAAIRPLAENGGVLVTFRDVTELREIDKELHNTKLFLESVIQSAGDGVVAADVDGKIILFNSAAEQILGYTSREVVNRMAWTSLFTGAEGDDVLAQMRVEQVGVRGLRYDLRNRLGEPVPVHMTAAMIYQDKREIAIVGIFTDIRDRLRNEERARSLMEQIAQREAQMEAVAMVVHALNQPLTAMLGYAEFLKQPTAAPEMQRRACEVMGTESQRLAALLQKLGQLMREAGWLPNPMEGSA